MLNLSLKRLLHSYSFRIALLYLLFFLVSTSILFSFIYITSTRSITEQLSERIRIDEVDFSNRFAQSGLNGLIRLVNSRAQYQGHLGAYSIINRNQQIIAGNLARWPIGVSPNETSELMFQGAQNNNDHHTYRGKVIGLTEGHKLLVARSNQRVVEAQAKLIRTFTWATIITLVLGLAGGYILSRRAVRRITSINRLCRNIIEGDISQRLNINQAQDDLDDLSLNINSMLDKIESLMKEIVLVSDNIAHDMRTPLSHLRLDLESLQTHPNLDAHTLARLEQSVESTDNIIATFNALLRISKIEAKNNQAQFKSLDITKLISDVIELYQPVMDDKSQNLTAKLQPKLGVTGDKDLLFQAIANLIDNASKYSPENGRIEISAFAENQQIVVSICDSGPGVPNSDIEKLTQRFYRLDEARSKPGNGLGLSLVKAIANIHKATLALSNRKNGGLCALLRFT